MVRIRSTASRLVFAALAMQVTLMPLCADDPRATAKNNWSQLAPIPDPLGVAGPYVGVAKEALIVAGGANFASGVRPWNGGVKTWHDTIFLLDKPQGAWRTSTTRLPRPLGY